MDGLSIVLITTFAITTVAGVAGSVFSFKELKKAKFDLSKNKGVVLSEEEAIEKASQIAKSKILEAEKKVLSLEKTAQEQAASVREKFKEQEMLLAERERNLVDRNKTLDKRFDEIEEKEKSLDQAKRDVKNARQQLSEQLEKIAKLTRAEAEALLKEEVDKDLGDWKAKKIKESKQQIEFEADEIAKKVLVETMHNAATDYVAETTTTTLTIDDETLKGKIIGKDGRNIRTFEKLTGVDVIIDEAPNQVTLSCFDPIRREVGAIAMKKLLQDGRVHPGTIEETVEKVKKDLLKEIKKTGEEIAFETGFNDLPTEIIMLLGRFKYRFSYGQNLVKHTLEMVKIGEQLAMEVGADVQTVKLACLLHDIGKVVPQEGKQHHHISADIARKYYKDDRLVNAIEAHHYDIESKSVEAELVRIADAISGARPGARRDSYEDYVKRIRALEDIAKNQKGVEAAFAIHAGREVRVLVKPDQVTDKDVDTMAFEIAKEIEKTQSYPGVIKVNVIREYRKTEEAK